VRYRLAEFSTIFTERMMKKYKEFFFVSATPPELDNGNLVMVETKENPIPKQNRPILFIPIARVVYRTLCEETYEKIASAVRAFLTDYLRTNNTRAILHCHSYSHGEILHKKLSDIAFFPSKDMSPDKAFSAFMESNKEIYITPNLGTGIDLKGDGFQLQFVAKVPYPDLGDPSVRQMRSVMRKEAFNLWYLQQTAHALTQMCSRICRDPNDFGLTVVLDQEFENFYTRARDLLPDYIKEAIIGL